MNRRGSHSRKPLYIAPTDRNGYELVHSAGKEMTTGFKPLFSRGRISIFPRCFSTILLATVNNCGSAQRVAPPSDPTVRLRLDREDFIDLAGGRRAPSSARVEGDQELGHRVLGAFAVTP